MSWLDATDALAEATSPAPQPPSDPAGETGSEAGSDLRRPRQAPGSAPAAAGSVAAEGDLAEPAGEPPADATAEPEKKKKKRRDRADAAEGDGAVRSRAGRIQLKGRVFARAELQRGPRRVIEGTNVTSRSRNSLDLDVQSVRVGLEYEAPMPWLTAVAELELTGKPSLKDGFVQARSGHYQLRAGQFKVPASAIESESPWVLPLAGRGMLHDLLVDWLDVGGRRPGAVFTYRSGGPLHLRLSGGAFQGSLVADAERKTDTIKNMSLDAQSLVARAQIKAGPAAIGAWYEHRVGSPAIGRYQYYPTAGLDVTVDEPLPGGGIRIWLETIAGESWFELPQLLSDADDTWFVAGRAIVAWRFGGMAQEALYIEPFAQLAGMDPDRNIRTDLFWEAALGVNAGFWDRARITLQGEISRGQRNFPSGFRLGNGYLLARDPDHIGLLLQAGVAW